MRGFTAVPAASPAKVAPGETRDAKDFETRKLSQQKNNKKILADNRKKAVAAAPVPRPEFPEFVAANAKKKASMSATATSGPSHQWKDVSNVASREGSSAVSDMGEHLTETAKFDAENDDDFDDIEYKLYMEKKRVEWYARRFEFWVPKQQEMADDSSDSDDEETHARIKREKEEHDTTVVIPVEEVLDRLVIKSIRMKAARRFVFFLAFVTFYYTSLVFQRSLADSYSLESSIKRRFLGVTGTGEDGVTYNKIADIPQLWDWLEGGFLQLVFPDDHW